MKKALTLSASLVLTACNHLQGEQNINYQNFIAPKRIVQEKIPVHIPEQKVFATFNLSEDPKVIQAYKEYSKKGIAKNITGKGVEIIAYNPYSQPTIQCAPLHLCVIQLENGEKINNIDIGDSINWLISTSNVGTQENGSYQITLKPKATKLATDLIITTTKRTYNIALVSLEEATTRILSFYYPEDTFKENLKKLSSQNNQDNNILTTTNIDINNINFNYTISAEKYAIAPVRAFDDGTHTLLEMPNSITENNLPVLYLNNNDKQELVNYRYKHPYYIIDGLFQKAALISANNKKTIIARG